MTRRTEQRAAIRKVFSHVQRPLSVQEVLEYAQSDVPKIGIATVYRNIKALVEESWLETVDIPGEPSRYERAGIAHHHHFQCEGCGRVFDVPGCASLVEDHHAPEGFVVSRHEVMLYGSCADCASSSQGKQVLASRGACDHDHHHSDNRSEHEHTT